MALFLRMFRRQRGPHVLWTLKARTGLTRSCLVTNKPGGLSRAQVDRMLTATFPQGDVIVHEVLMGFRPRDNQQILLVEAVADNDDECGSFVVKIGPAEQMRGELNRWRECRRPGPPGDPVFMPLRAGYPTMGGSEPFAVIVYDNALRFIGEDQECTCTTLEDAVIDAVRFNSPAISTVLSALDYLFARAALVLHSHKRLLKPSAGDFVLPSRRLPEALRRWDQAANFRNLRCYLDTHISRLERHDHLLPIRRYLGPIPFLRCVLEVAAGPDRLRRAEGQPVQGLPPLLREEVIPELHRGAVHGDFHGRNILVGVMRERAGIRAAQVRWPVVFDYGDVSRDGYVGMDFVKLETELKVRSYPTLFGALNRHEFTRAVHDFEWRLALDTEEEHFAVDVPAGLGLDDQLGRLRAVLLRIRQRAAEQLRAARDQGTWQEEYFFLLCCYGVIPSVFETYSEENLIAALLSAGVAAARLPGPRQRFEQEMRRVRELLQQLDTLD